MSKQSKKPDPGYVSGMDDIGVQLREHAGDAAMLQKIHVAVRNMLDGSKDGEAGIRKELQRRFDSGQIRPESFELVQKILDRIVLEKSTANNSTADLGATESPLPSQDDAETMDASTALNLEFKDTAALDEKVQDSSSHDQTIRIATPFPQQPPPDTSPTDEVPQQRADDDREFIETAVLEGQASATKTPSDQLQVGSVLRDRFLLQEKMAGGSMGVVFKALDRRLAEAGEGNPYVAIKILSSRLSRNANALRALQQEAAKGRYLSHPNIVRFLDLDREDDLYFIVMEWLEGRSLAKILDDSPGKKMDVETALNITNQVSRALDYAHLRGVVHADVKPGNIMITSEGHAKLLDFGVARVRQKQSAEKPRFDPTVLGATSPAYSSMQVLTGDDPAPTDDVFSLACLFYRLVAGIRVFGPRNAADAAAAGMEPQRPAGLQDTQWKALKKALAYSRVTRYPTPKAFTDALGGKTARFGIGKPAAPDKETLSAAAGMQELPQPPETVMRAMRAPPVEDDYPDDFDDDASRSPWRWIIPVIAIAAVAAYFTQSWWLSHLEELKDADWLRIPAVSTPATQTPAADGVAPGSGDDDIIALPMEEGPEIAETVLESSEEILTNTGPAESPETDTDSPIDETRIDQPAFDYSAFLPPSLVVLLRTGNDAAGIHGLTMIENGDPVVIEIQRSTAINEPLRLVLSEVQFSGTYSPLGAGQYMLQDDGVIEFVAGQERAQTTLRMSQNTLVEPDQDVSLQLVAESAPNAELATININLVDDDEPVTNELPPAIESPPPNQISLVASQITVRESDPAVQIDIRRQNADTAFIDVGFVLIDQSATEGQDYFAPRYDYVTFGPGQETDRILIPLGQDTLIEPDETFVLELQLEQGTALEDNLLRVTVMIQDDDR